MSFFKAHKKIIFLGKSKKFQFSSLLSQSAIIYQDFFIPCIRPMVNIFDDPIKISNSAGILPLNLLNRLNTFVEYKYYLVYYFCFSLECNEKSLPTPWGVLVIK